MNEKAGAGLNAVSARPALPPSKPHSKPRQSKSKTKDTLETTMYILLVYLATSYF